MEDYIADRTKGFTVDYVRGHFIMLSYQDMTSMWDSLDVRYQVNQPFNILFVAFSAK